MTRWNFTPLKVLMLCLWSFLFGSWTTDLMLHFELGLRPQWTSVILGLTVALGSLALWLSWSRQPVPVEE